MGGIKGDDFKVPPFTQGQQTVVGARVGMVAAKSRGYARPFSKAPLTFIKAQLLPEQMIELKSHAHAILARLVQKHPHRVIARVYIDRLPGYAAAEFSS